MENYNKEYFNNKNDEYLNGIDLRTTEGKEFKKYDSYIIRTDEYNRVINFNGKMKSEDVDWFFDTYNLRFNKKLKRCNCPGQIRRMISKIKTEYEKRKI